MSELVLRNRQGVRRVDTRLLRRIVRALLAELFAGEHHEVCIHLVGAKEMARINERFLDHEGSTDVITFNHLEQPEGAGPLHGEIFVCVDDAVAQGAQFKTSWQSEMVRYVIHGILHLQGHDDLRPRARRVMKREENRILRSTSKRFSLAELAKASPGRAARAKKGR